MTFTRPQALAALREIVLALGAAWDLDTALDLIARKTTEVMQVDSCTIYLLDPDGESLRLQATTGLAKRALGRATLKVGEGMTGYAAAHNCPIFDVDAVNNPHFKHVYEAEETLFSSLLAIPLVLDGKPIGALNVQTYEPYEFSSDEIEILSLIGDVAASALVRAQLYDRQKRQIEELRTLAQVSEAVTSPQYLDDILDIVTEMAAQVMEAALCAIFLLDESGTRLERYSARRSSGGFVRYRSVALGEGIVGQVAGNGRSTTIPNVPLCDDANEAALAKEAGLVSLLAVPLTVRGQVIGVLNCYTAVSHTFTPEQHALLNTLANQTALAIQNAQLITNTAVVREMHHRIKNNLQTVAMLMQLQLPDAARLDTRQVLETNINRIHSIAAVHEALSEKGFRLVNINDVLQRISQMTISSMVTPGQDIQIQVHGAVLQLPSKEATALAVVVNELVQNSLEHAFAGRKSGQIDISLGHSPQEWIVLVRDNGRGLPPDFKHGLGLEVATTLVRDDLNGRIKFNPLSPGTEASIRIPR